MNLRIAYFILLYVFLLLLSACNTNSYPVEEYVAIYKRDTAYLKLTIYSGSYDGNLLIKGAGAKVEKGRIQGQILGDTLIGSFLYRPYKSKLEKRRAFVLKRDGDKLIQGNGLENVYMGITYYDPASINFENPKLIFLKAVDYLGH